MKTKRIACILALLAATRGAHAQVDPLDARDAVIERERIRAQVETLLADITTPRSDDDDPVFDSVTSRLIELGPAAQPFLAAELEHRSRVTFNVVAYVLGFLGGEEAGAALRKAAEAADAEGGEFARHRKAWVGYSLALMGDSEAVDVLDSGGVNATRLPFMHEVSTLEIVSVLTAPACVPRLLDKLDRYAADDALKERLTTVLAALRRVADASARPRVLPYLEHELPWVREAAARVLVGPGDPAVADRLLEALKAEPVAVARFGIAAALEELLPAGKIQALLSRLEVEDDTAVRGALYRIVAKTGGEPALEPLVRHWGRRDPLDRIWLLDAVGKIGSPKAQNLLQAALADADPRVVLRAMAALGELGGSRATDSLLAMLRDPRWPVEGEAIRLLVRKREPRAAPRIADRLRERLAAPNIDLAERDGIRQRGEALVSLRHVAVLPDLRKAAATYVADPALGEHLSDLVKQLEALVALKDDVRKWSEALSSPEPSIRKLAYDRLSEIGGPAAATALIGAFGRVDTPEGVEILAAIARMRSPEAAPLVERILDDPTFDAHARRPLRQAAAWAASRIGGERMAAALRRSAERREGRDVDVLVYLATLTGRDAVPLLRTLRVARLRHFDWRRGPEMQRLDWIVRELSAGRSIASLDAPPWEIELH